MVVSLLTKYKASFYPRPTIYALWGLNVDILWSEKGLHFESWGDTVHPQATTEL